MVGALLLFVKNSEQALRRTHVPSKLARRLSPFRFSPLRSRGAARLSFTARIGRAQFHRARSASKKDSLAAPPPIFLTGARGPCYHDRCFTRLFKYFQVNRWGAVAQLGARVNGIHEVAGSIPASSTKIVT
jgi:hypothetical protein